MGGPHDLDVILGGELKAGESFVTEKKSDFLLKVSGTEKVANDVTQKEAEHFDITRVVG